MRALAPYSAPLEVSEHVAYVSNVHGREFFFLFQYISLSFEKKGLPAVPKQRNFVLASEKSLFGTVVFF